MAKRSNRDKRFQREVRLVRDGSGSRVVFLPNSISGETPESWLEKMKRLAECNYGEMTIVVQTQHSGGYGGYPGCALHLFPGSNQGTLDDDKGTKLYDFSPADLARGGGVVSPRVPVILTNYNNLKDLRNTLTVALRDMRKRKEKR